MGESVKISKTVIGKKLTDKVLNKGELSEII
jgi:hypothetical protein